MNSGLPELCPAFPLTSDLIYLRTSCWTSWHTGWWLFMASLIVNLIHGCLLNFWSVISSSRRRTGALNWLVLLLLARKGARRRALVRQLSEVRYESVALHRLSVRAEEIDRCGFPTECHPCWGHSSSATISWSRTSHSQTWRCPLYSDSVSHLPSGTSDSSDQFDSYVLSFSKGAHSSGIHWRHRDWPAFAQVRPCYRHSNSTRLCRS